MCQTHTHDSRPGSSRHTHRTAAFAGSAFPLPLVPITQTGLTRHGRTKRHAARMENRSVTRHSTTDVRRTLVLQLYSTVLKWLTR